MIMNIKQFLVIKALDVLPWEITKIIWEQLEDISAKVIQTNILRLVYKKIGLTMFMYSKLVQFSNDNLYFNTGYVIDKFLHWSKTVNFLYIDDTDEWLKILNRVRYRFNIPYIFQLTDKIILDIKYKKREYKVRLGKILDIKFNLNESIMSTRQYISWIYREDVMFILLQSYRSINEIPPNEFIKIINIFETDWNFKNYANYVRNQEFNNFINKPFYLNY